MSQFKIPNQITTLPLAPTLAQVAGGNLTTGAYIYAISFLVPGGETMIGNTTLATTLTGGNNQFALTNISLGQSNCTGRKIYRTLHNGTTFYYLNTIHDNTTTTYSDNLADTALNAQYIITANNVDPSLDTTGILNVNAFLQQTVGTLSVAGASSANNICNGSAVAITITGLSNATGVNVATLIKNNYVTNNSNIIATIDGYTGTVVTNGIPIVFVTGISLGQFTINITNVGVNNLSGSVIVFCEIIN